MLLFLSQACQYYLKPICPKLASQIFLSQRITALHELWPQRTILLLIQKYASWHNWYSLFDNEYSFNFFFKGKRSMILKYSYKALLFNRPKRAFLNKVNQSLGELYTIAFIRPHMPPVRGERTPRHKLICFLSKKTGDSTFNSSRCAESIFSDTSVKLVIQNMLLWIPKVNRADCYNNQ
jgi:hypothetical protein